MTYRELHASLLAEPTLERGDGATEDEISKAERAIGFVPDDFRRFVADFGWVAFKHYEIFGLGHDVPDYLNLTEVTLCERRDAGLPDSLIPVMNDGGGNLFCFAAGVLAQMHSPMWLWVHDSIPFSPTPLQHIADTFSDWLSALL